MRGWPPGAAGARVIVRQGLEQVTPGLGGLPVSMVWTDRRVISVVAVTHHQSRTMLTVIGWDTSGKPLLEQGMLQQGLSCFDCDAAGFGREPGL